MIPPDTAILNTVMLMKLIGRIVLLFLIAVSVMFFLYPVLHEAGHLLAALLCGIEISGVGLFPVAYVQAAPARLSPAALMFFALSGCYFPLLALLLPPYRLSWVGFVKLTVAVMTLSFALTSLLTLWGVPLSRGAFDDAAAVLNIFPQCRIPVILLLLLALTASALYIAFSKPLSRTAAILAGESVFKTHTAVRNTSVIIPQKI